MVFCWTMPHSTRNEILKNQAATVPPKAMFDEFEQGMKRERRRLVEHLKRRACIKTVEVEEAMLAIPRHLFVPQGQLRNAYVDSPLSIGEEQTISAPHMVAMMADELAISPGESILEVGGGSGYHAAIYAYLTGKQGTVVSVERIANLVSQAKRNLESLKQHNIPLAEIRLVHADGNLGHEEEAPFDKISVACTAQELPEALIRQLKEGGTMVIPVGSSSVFFGQELLRIEKKGGAIMKKQVCSVAFVPLQDGVR